MTRGTLKICCAIWAAMMLRLSPFVRDAKPSADSMPASRSTSSSIPLPGPTSPAKSLPSRSKARRLLSITVTWWPALERARAAIAPTRPQPTMTSFMKEDPFYVLVAERQPSSLYRGQPSPQDLGLGGLDGGGHALKEDVRPAEVNDREGCVRVAIAGLPDTAWVDERRGR